TTGGFKTGTGSRQTRRFPAISATARVPVPVLKCALVTCNYETADRITEWLQARTASDEDSRDVLLIPLERRIGRNGFRWRLHHESECECHSTG
ncbi:MAG: hypothetical protein ACK58T_47425, partial [Phycisphaerae bacterium]